MKPIGTVAFGLALIAGGAGAQAQTSVTRQVTSEPVETVVTQGPNGTAVTRRILTPEPGVSTFAAPPLDYAPLGAGALAPDYVEAAETVTTRRMTPSYERSPAGGAPSTVGISSRTPVRAQTARVPRERAQTRIAVGSDTRNISRTQVRTDVRTAVRTVAPPPPVIDQPLALSPAERQLVYRSIVQRDVYPSPTIYPADYGYAGYGYPRYDDRDYGYRDYGYRDYAYGDYGYRDYRYRDRYVYRWDGVPLVVGARIPPSVPLVAMPEPVGSLVPAARPYAYAVLDNRVYLVDPATGIIVAEIVQ
jgi:hypothetical protein